MTLEECKRFVNTNAEYYRLKPGHGRLYGFYSSIYCFLVELEEMRKEKGDSFQAGYKKALDDMREAMAKKVTEEVERCLIYGEDPTTYDFHKQYNGQFKKAGDSHDRT